MKERWRSHCAGLNINRDQVSYRIGQTHEIKPVLQVGGGVGLVQELSDRLQVGWVAADQIGRNI